nr:ribonuclease E/G [Geodermatophilaceae bacterium]
DDDRPSEGDEADAGRAADDGSGDASAESAPRAAAGETASDDDAGGDGAGGDGTGGEGEGSGTKRRRRRRRRGEDAEEDPGAGSAPRTRERAADEVQGVRGSTRLEAKRQRRRDGRDQGRRRPPILSEAEFLARREAVDRVMVVRQQGDRTQIAVLEDSILVEHYVTKASATAFAGNVYLGRVQNVLPSMEAAFIDIGKGRNAVLYAGEVNWDAAGLAGKSRSIEHALKSGDKVLVQVSKDPIGQKGARLTSQISLPGRYLVYVPNESMTGISRKLPDIERQRLKEILRRIVPEGAGVIIRTAAEGASEEELTRDVNRLKAQWEVISERAAQSGTSAPSLLYEEPDLAIRVVRDVFNEDFSRLTVSGDEAWETLQDYVAHVAPDLAPRLAKHEGERDLFAEVRVEEQLLKALDRKVYLPSGGSLVIDRTEAMTVIDVNTGKFIGSGGNLEQTVTRNNIEAAEEIVRQLRLRDIGGIIVIDFIDMVLESNRDLVLRRLTECLGRDRTKHQVAEVTSLGLVQMTRKRVGQGLLEAFSEPCDCCNGRGIIVHAEPVDDSSRRPSDNDRSDRRSGTGEQSGRGTRSSSAKAAAVLPTLDPNAPGPRSVAAATFAASAATSGRAPADTSGPAETAGLSDGAGQPDSAVGTEISAQPASRRRRRAASATTTAISADSGVVPEVAAEPASTAAAEAEKGGQEAAADIAEAVVERIPAAATETVPDAPGESTPGALNTPETVPTTAAESAPVHPSESVPEAVSVDPFESPPAELASAAEQPRRRRRAASRPAGPPSTED